MPIKVVNGYMRECLRTQYNKGKLHTTAEIIDKYNGVDVDNLYYSKRRDSKAIRLNFKEAQRKLKRYLSKYISKNNIQSARLPWHCSRDISALFTSELLNDDEYNRLICHVNARPDLYKTYQTDGIIIYIPLFPVSLADYTDLQRINNLIFEKFYKKT